MKNNPFASRLIQAAAVVASTQISFTAPVTIRAAAEPDEGQAAGLPTFEMLAYNGGPLKLRGWEFPVVVDLTGLTGVDTSKPALKDHDPSKVVGHTERITVGTSTITADGVVSGTGDAAREVVSASQNGFPWQVSIGANTQQVEFVPAGRSAQANGQTWFGPINIARRASLGEISFVGLGADQQTAARIAAVSAEGSAMTFEDWLICMGLDINTLTGDQIDKLRAKYDKETAEIVDTVAAAAATQAAGTVAASAAASTAAAAAATASLDINAFAAAAATAATTATRTAAAAESTRIASVRTICAGRHATIEAQAISEGWNDSTTELAVLRAERPQAGNNGGRIAASFGINVGAGSEVTTDIVAAACAIAGGVGETHALAGLNEQQRNIVVSRKVRNQVGSIHGLCSIVAAAHGMAMPSSRMDEDVLRTMMTIERRMEIQADAGGYSTMSLSGITENILNKAMLEAYGNVDSVVSDIAYETDTNDFKPFKRYRLTTSGLLQALGQAGDLKSITLQDESYTNQVKTQGVILTLTREILMNDDMGAIIQAPTMLGRGAALFREMMVFKQILALAGLTAPGASVGDTANGFNFLSTGANNYLTGGTSVLGIPSLTTAVKQFREQTDANGMPIMLKPDRLLVPPALEVTAQNLFNGANLVAVGVGNTKAVEPNVNAHAGKYRPIVAPFLSAAVAPKAKIGVGSDTGWYLLGNPAGGFAPVQIGYLRGQRTPVIERGETAFNTLGIAMRCYWDFGVAAHDYRTVVGSAGA